jgi:hypothetical protein
MSCRYRELNTFACCVSCTDINPQDCNSNRYRYREPQLRQKTCHTDVQMLVHGHIKSTSFRAEHYNISG